MAQRVEAGVEELDFDHWHLRESLARSHIALDNRVMSQLSIWEPRTFRLVGNLVSYQKSFCWKVKKRAEKAHDQIDYFFT